MHTGSTRRLAIVGLGPRGLGALEALADSLPTDAPATAVDVFETFPELGAGPNFDPREIEVCRLNIPIRDIDIRPREASACGGFAQWLGTAPDPDSFPARAELGRYLEARFDELSGHSALSLSHHSLRIDAVRRDGAGWHLQGGDTWFGPYAEVLLTLGQPEVAPDAQLADWQAHERRSRGTLANAYPARDLAARARDWAGQTVAVRGLALSAFDVIRVLTVAQGGRFDDGVYVPSGREPARILPFSLDGLPPFPKPETQELDARFTPTEDETDTFADLMAQAAVAASPDAVPGLINAALVPVAARIQAACGGNADRTAIARWLDTEWTAPGTQEAAGPVALLHAGIAMADGRLAPTIGYTVGQIWRKWQDEVRKGFNPARTPPATATALVGFDEGLKRYSYGPPVSTCREVSALIEAGIVDPGLSADPEIDLVSDGWTLRTDDRQATAGIMVDAVLPSPDLANVTAPLVSGLVSDGRFAPVAEGLGGRTAADGTVIGTDGQPSAGLAFLGRLALGSVIAVDSLHDCFGEASRRWARGVVERLQLSGGHAQP